MKITIPTNGSRGMDEEVAQHFGRCKTYTVLDENGNIVEIFENTSEHMGGSGLPPELMKKHGTNILLCRDIGPRALMLCNELGIEVFIGDADTVREMFKIWKESKLKKADINDTCKQHGL